MNNADRQDLVTKANYLIRNADLIDYAEVRPMTTRDLSWTDVTSKFARGELISMDCSEAVTELYRWAGLQNPNGGPYNGEGYTGTLYNHLSKHYTDPADAHPGALLIFGTGSVTEHVAMVIEQGTNPVLFSHGSEIGPLRISYTDESAYHPGAWRRFLDVSSIQEA